jgi:hypothetical protein
LKAETSEQSKGVSAEVEDLDVVRVLLGGWQVLDPYLRGKPFSIRKGMKSATQGIQCHQQKKPITESHI